METSSLTYKTFKNILYNVIGYIWPMVFALLITPIVIFHLGIKNYGIYLFINVIISFLGLLDLGIGIAVSKHMAFYYGKRDSAGITALTHTANSLFLLIGIFGLIVSLAIALFGPVFFACAICKLRPVLNVVHRCWGHILFQQYRQFIQFDPERCSTFRY